MTFKEFCERQGFTKEEKRLAAIFLMTLRLVRMWEALMGGDK